MPRFYRFIFLKLSRVKLAMWFVKCHSVWNSPGNWMLVEKKIFLGREALKHGQQVCEGLADYTHTHPFALHLLLSLQTQHIRHFAMWLWVAQIPHTVPKIGTLDTSHCLVFLWSPKLIFIKSNDLFQGKERDPKTWVCVSGAHMFLSLGHSG